MKKKKSKSKKSKKNKKRYKAFTPEGGGGCLLNINFHARGIRARFFKLRLPPYLPRGVTFWPENFFDLIDLDRLSIDLKSIDNRSYVKAYQGSRAKSSCKSLPETSAMNRNSYILIMIIEKNLVENRSISIIDRF